MQIPIAFHLHAKTPEFTMLQERDLIQQCLSGNRDAFRKLIEPHQDFVFRVALSVLGRREEAEEAAQDAFVRAYRGLVSFSGQVPFQAWLYRIAVRTALNARRRRRRRRLLERLTPPSWFGSLASARTDAPDVEVAKRDVRIRLRATIDRLPRKLHEVVVLTYLDELACGEIAEILDIPEGTVKSRLHRAREKLQKEIKRQGLLD